MDDGRHPSPRRVKELGPEGNCGDAARRACAEWRWTATQLLLDSAAGGGVVLAMNYMMKTVIFQLREWERKTHPHDLNISTWTQNRAPANMIQKRGSSVETIFYKVSFH